MFDSIQGALMGVLDRSTSAVAESEGDYYARLSATTLKRTDITPTEKTALAGVDRCCRGRGETGSSDQQMADACGLPLSTFQRALRHLRLKGLVAVLGRTCRRIIRLLTSYRKGSEPKGAAPESPSPVTRIPLTHEANSPHR